MIPSTAVGFGPAIISTGIGNSVSAFDVAPSFAVTSGATNGLSFSSGLVPLAPSILIVPPLSGTFASTPAFSSVSVATTTPSPLVANSAASETLVGTSGDDHLVGASGNDALFGLAGRDALIGGFGNDRLEGGSGDDLLSGGPGADLFVFRAGDGHDVITDFAPNGVVVMAASPPVTNLAAVPTLANPALFLATATADELLLLRPAGEAAPAIQSALGDTMINFANGDSIRLVGVPDPAHLLSDHLF